MHRKHLSQNLRTLLARYGTLTDGARHIGINRQQLNKYLNGSSYPSTRTLNQIASALGVQIDLLLTDPDTVRNTIETTGAEPFLAKLGITKSLKLAAQRAVLDQETLATSCGDYLLHSRSANSESLILTSLIRIYQTNGQTLAKALIPLRENASPQTAIPTYLHESLVFLNSGFLHLFRMTHLGGGETDLGLMILERPRFPKANVMNGHALTSSVTQPGKIMPTPILMRRVTGNILSLYRKHCGAWSMDSPQIDDTIRAFFTTNA